MRTLFAAAFVAACCTFGLTVAFAQPVATFKSSVDVVPISVVVHDGRGRMITTLRATDFEVRDKGERRPILTFQTDDASPITLAVVVDVSGSMRLSSKLTYAREVVRRLGMNLEDGRDEVGLFTFDDALHEQQPFTSHPASLDEALSHADPWGVTSLYDAIGETARRLATRPAPRRAIIVITDGIDTSSTQSAGEVSALASGIDAPVYVVATGPRIDRTGYLERTTSRLAGKSADLQDLAAWTGGGSGLGEWSGRGRGARVSDPHRAAASVPDCNRLGGGRRLATDRRPRARSPADRSRAQWVLQQALEREPKAVLPAPPAPPAC